MKNNLTNILQEIYRNKNDKEQIQHFCHSMHKINIIGINKVRYGLYDGFFSVLANDGESEAIVRNLLDEIDTMKGCYMEASKIDRQIAIDRLSDIIDSHEILHKEDIKHFVESMVEYYHIKVSIDKEDLTNYFYSLLEYIIGIIRNDSSNNNDELTKLMYQKIKSLSK